MPWWKVGKMKVRTQCEWQSNFCLINELFACVVKCYQWYFLRWANCECIGLQFCFVYRTWLGWCRASGSVGKLFVGGRSHQCMMLISNLTFLCIIVGQSLTFYIFLRNFHQYQVVHLIRCFLRKQLYSLNFYDCEIIHFLLRFPFVFFICWSSPKYTLPSTCR